jgi:hypothetical protein
MQGFSLLGASIGARLLIAVLAMACLWALVFWAVA